MKIKKTKSSPGNYRLRQPDIQRKQFPELSDAPSRLGLAISSVLALTFPHASNADTPASASNALEEIVVTARKREENLQTVPISIDVFTKRDIQNLGITQFNDYAEKVPSISFISAGPGTQVFVMRGASDGSNPNYSNSSSTGFFVDDMSVSYNSGQPDLHLYDIAQIEILNGPQGTTYGAGSMSGAIRYTTNKPDVNAFSAGIDLDSGKIKGGGLDQTYEGFINLPIIDGVLALRVSGFGDFQGGYINNQLTTRYWTNGTVSNNSAWAADRYNREHVEGGRVALKTLLSDAWSASLTYSYQRQQTTGAFDEDLQDYGRLTVSRFGPQSSKDASQLYDFHVDGDVGIGDLVLASTYWSMPTRSTVDYSEYVKNFDGGSKQSFTCLSDPIYGGTPYQGCNVPAQWVTGYSSPERWSDEVRLSSKPGGQFHWLAGLYWEKTRETYGSAFAFPGLRTDGAAFHYYESLYGTTSSSLPPGVWYAYRTRTDTLQTDEFANISYDLTSRLNVEAGVVHFHSNTSSYSPFGGYAYAPPSPTAYSSAAHKVNSKFGVNYKLTDAILLYADFGQGFRDGGSNSGLPSSCYAKGVPPDYVPDTLNNYELGWKTTSLGGRLLFNGAAYLMNWQDLQTVIYDANLCPSASFEANVGKARIYGSETNVSFKLDEHWSLQGAASYTDPRIVSTSYPTFQQEVGERLPFAPYFSWSWNLRYEHGIGGSLSGYVQLDEAHKGDMWNDLHAGGDNGFPRLLQPSYTISNLRVGNNPKGAHWLAELYIRNLTDTNAIIYSNTGNFDVRETTNEPRVIGIRANYRFGKEVNSD